MRGDGVDQDCDGLDCNSQTLDGVHFVVCPDPQTWAAAQATCADAGLDGLATVTSDAEQELLLELNGGSCASGATGCNFVWIGLTDAATEDAWVWVSGVADSYTNWSGGQPSGSDNGFEEDCVVFRHQDALWDDRHCEHDAKPDSRALPTASPASGGRAGAARRACAPANGIGAGHATRHPLPHGRPRPPGPR